MHKVLGIRFISCQAVEKRPPTEGGTGMLQRLSALGLHRSLIDRSEEVNGKLNAPNQ
jgi:hypothetical protein